MVTLCAPARPMALPKKPAMMAASSGSIGMASSKVGFMPASAFHRIQVFDVDAPAFAEQHDEDGEADGGLRRGHGQHEEHEHLPADVAEVARERHEVRSEERRVGKECRSRWS